MNLLAFDTSTEILSIALQVGDAVSRFEQAAGPQASALILPQIQVLLDAAQVKLADLDGIAYGAGPGAFTGVRVACGVAQGLGFGAAVPVIGINTLHAVAEASGAPQVLVATDARMGELYFAALQKQGGDWYEVLPSTLLKPNDLPEIAGDDWVGAGNGWVVYADALQAKYNVLVHADIAPRAEAILRLAAPQFAAGKGMAASEARPIYMRNRVALTEAQRAAGERL